MTPTLWIAVGYGVVLATLVVYTVGLHRRLWRAERIGSPRKDSR